MVVAIPGHICLLLLSIRQPYRPELCPLLLLLVTHKTTRNNNAKLTDGTLAGNFLQR